ncbi:MAG: ABC transporter ATP-binding protein [Paludibacteraceae bacterium]|nr:ABC transporter ATP-binding protein [Paludibacteraceae bacterium]
MIQLKNVTFSYSRRAHLLNDLSLTLDAGRIHGLLGKNGEGKSTLLKLISGLVFAQSGEIDVLGFHPQKREPQLLSDIFFLSEELPQINLSIEKFEKVYSPFYQSYDAALFNRFLSEFEIKDKKANMTRLSHGQKKKVMIAFGLATNTKLLLMDEPTNGLDIPSKAQFRRMVASVIDDQRCLVISTHQVHDLDGLIDSISIMEQHKIVFHYTISEISDKLCFRMVDHIAPKTDCVYSEDTLRGRIEICINEKHEDTKVDIELLFNAVVSNQQQINSLF